MTPLKTTLLLGFCLSVAACASSGEDGMFLTEQQSGADGPKDRIYWQWSECGDFSDQHLYRNEGNCYRPYYIPADEG